MASQGITRSASRGQVASRSSYGHALTLSSGLTFAPCKQSSINWHTQPQSIRVSPNIASHVPQGITRHHKVGITRSGCKPFTIWARTGHTLFWAYICACKQSSINWHTQPQSIRVSPNIASHVPQGITRHHKASQGITRSGCVRPTATFWADVPSFRFCPVYEYLCNSRPPLTTPLTSPYWRASRRAEPSHLQRRRSQKAFEAQVHIGELPSLRGALR
jgi:hypothetical protein